jgi:hypothetical protein
MEKTRLWKSNENEHPRRDKNGIEILEGPSVPQEGEDDESEGLLASS